MPRGWLAQIVIRAVLSVILLLAHPFGLLLYAMVLGALAIGPHLDVREWAAMLRRVAPAVISVLIVVVLFVVFVPSLPGAQEHAGLSTMPGEFKVGLAEFRLTPVRKVFNLFFALRAYSNAIDGVTIMALFRAARLGVGLAAVGRACRAAAAQCRARRDLLRLPEFLHWGRIGRCPLCGDDDVRVRRRRRAHATARAERGHRLRARAFLRRPHRQHRRHLAGAAGRHRIACRRARTDPGPERAW